MKHALSLLALCLASPALALSCLPPDAVAMYERARDADERFIIVRGRIEPLAEVALPDGQTGPEKADTPARLTGLALSSDGFSKLFDREITLRLTCFGPWCANAPTDAEVFVPVMVDGSDMVLVLDPCFSTLIEADDAGEARLLACHEGRACETGF